MKSIVCKDGLAAKALDLSSISFASISGVQTGLKPSCAQKVCRLTEVDSKALGEWFESARNKDIKADSRKEEIWLEIDGKVFWASSTKVEAKKFTLGNGEGAQAWKFSFSEMKSIIHSNN